MIFDHDLKECLAVLKNGGVILYPTDTIWGLGCDATNQAAVEKIYKIKARQDNKSLLILVNGFGMLERYVEDIPETASRLAEISEDPLTIIYPEGKNLADGVCSEDGSVGVRICRDEFCSELITRFRKPIVSTSANSSGNPPPSFFAEIDSNISDNVDYIVNYRRDDQKKRTASPIIKIERNGTIRILRK
jgi:L-threonylcarbamoyladenylate synthase